MQLVSIVFQVLLATAGGALICQCLARIFGWVVGLSLSTFKGVTIISALTGALVGCSLMIYHCCKVYSMPADFFTQAFILAGVLALGLIRPIGKPLWQLFWMFYWTPFSIIDDFFLSRRRPRK